VPYVQEFKKRGAKFYIVILLILKRVFILGIICVGLVYAGLSNRPAEHASFYSFIENPSTDGIGKIYMGREIASPIDGHEAIEWLERNDREETERIDLVLQALDLKKTDHLADVGAGSGYITFRLAPLVAEGKVYAVEISQVMLKAMVDQKRRTKTKNVFPVLGTVESVQLPSKSVNVALMVDAYHEFSHPREMMESIVKALKPGGKVVLVEYRGEDPAIPIKPLHKMTQTQIKKEMAAVGLAWEETRGFLPSQHFIVFKKIPTL